MLDTVSSEKVERFRRKILGFYEEYGRTLPWRETTDQYKVWVSEVMLQQTQVSRVVPKYNEWMQEFADAEALGEAPLGKVLRLWQGLGYNRRAKWLKEGAEMYVASEPTSVEEWLEVKGVGPYTARAIRIFAANEDIVTVDTNIRRVFIHELSLPEDVTEEDLYDVAKIILPAGQSRDWHNALMDYGAMEATARETGISSTATQSKFEGSTRYYRGKVLRKATSSEVLRESLSEHEVDAAEALAEEGLLLERKDRFVLPGEEKP